MGSDKHKEQNMRIAELIAQNSHAIRNKVGAIVVKDCHIVSSGYNGTLHGDDNDCEVIESDGSLKTKCNVMHAELNALCYCAKHGISVNNADMYVTLSPCMQCALAIVQSGIKTVYYRNEYTDMSGVEYLKLHGVNVVKV